MNVYRKLIEEQERAAAELAEAAAEERRKLIVGAIVAGIGFALWLLWAVG